MAITITTLGAFPGANSKDKSARIPAAISALNKALAGDAQALVYMQQQAAGSATAVGKDAFNRALAIYDQNKPAAARASSDTPPVGLQPIPRAIPDSQSPLATIPPPPNRLPGWRWDPESWQWVFSPPINVDPVSTGISIPMSQPKPIGFDNSHPPVTFSPVRPTVTVDSLGNGIKPINIGVDGGVITGPPAPELSGPTSGPPAPADYGYVPPTTITKADGTSSTLKSSTTSTDTNTSGKVMLLLAAGVVLWFMVEGKRK